MEAESRHEEEVASAVSSPAALRQALNVGGAATAVAQALALQRSSGNRATARLLSRSPSDSHRAHEADFALAHPITAMEIYGADDTAEVEKPSTSALAVRFSVNLRNDKQTDIAKTGLTENAELAGSEVNAMRHTVWNAINVRRFGMALAKQAADSHEDAPNAIEGKDSLTQTFPTWAAADQGCDLRNNIIGRNIGLGNPNGGERAVAGVVLDVFHESGLYVVEKVGDTFKAVQRTISDSAYDGAKKKLANLNELGLTPDGQARWQAARDREAAIEEMRPPPWAD